MKQQKHAQSGKGFDNWVEIFRAGEQTSSNGSTRTWTHDDLDQIVANHSESDPTPIVIGHPKDNAPAYGWSEQLKRVGNSLFAKFKDVNPEFAEAVKSRAFRKRSIRLGMSDKGWRLVHTGFFGAKAVAIKGMADMQYQANDADYSQTLDFESRLDVRTPGLLKRILRRWREFIISEKDIDTADRLIPQYEIDEADDIEQYNRRHNEGLPYVGHVYSSPELFNAHNVTTQSEDKEDHAMDKQFTQDDIDAAKKQGKDEAEAEFKKSDKSSDLEQQLAQERHQNRVNRHETAVSKLIDEGRLTPGMARHLPEFMASLSDDADNEIEFSTDDDGKQKKPMTQLACFEEFINAFPKSFAHLFKEQCTDDNAPDTSDFSSEDLAAKARDFQESEKAKGREISISQAVAHVQSQSGK